MKKKTGLKGNPIKVKAYYIDNVEDKVEEID